MIARELPQELPAQLTPTEIQDFDYSTLDTETRIVVKQRTSEIRTLVHRQTQDAFDIGQKLLEVKSRLGHGHFGTWLEAEFEWSWDTANHFMNVYKHIGQIPNGSEFEARALYLLASPSTPEEARQEAKERASRGERITFSKAKAIRSQYGSADIVGSKTRRNKRITTVDTLAPTVGYESSTQYKTEALENEDEFPEVEPTRYATPSQSSPITVKDASINELDGRKVPEGKPAVETISISEAPKQVKRSHSTKDEEKEEITKEMMGVQQSELDFDESMEIDSCPTPVESMYLLLLSEAKEYLPSSQNLKFNEANLILRQVAANINLNTPAVAQVIQKHIEEFLETTISQCTANQIVTYLSVDQKEEFKKLI